MQPKFIWTTKIPDYRSKEDFEDAAWGVIKAQPDPRKLIPTIRTIHIRSRFMELGIEGVAYDEKENSLFAFTYISGVSRACYFDAHDKVQLLGI